MLLSILILSVGPLLAQVDQMAVPSPELDRAKAAAKALSTELMGRLMKEMKEGGPRQAVRVCAEVAPEIARAHSKDGVTVRRVSAKWRNPADEPDAFEVEALARLEAARREGRTSDEVSAWVEKDGRRMLRFVRPISVGAMCLSCHGDPAAIDPEVKQLLAEKYPGDKAVGYREGDFRGAVSVIVSAP